jgi:cobalt-zinc-cadmium efflux system protein
MSHNHSHHHHDHDHATQNIVLAFFLNLCFAFIELTGGLLTNSVAILSNALHDFGDSISLGIAWYLQKLSNKGGDKDYSYGYKRFSLLGAIIISVILLVGSIFVIQACVERLITPQASNAKGMLLLSILGIAVNGAAVFRLKKGTTFNERAVFLHLMEDVLGWIAVLIVSIVMLFVNISILDPLLSLAITAWVLTNVYKNLKATFKILMQKIPQEVDEPKLEQAINKLEKVKALHDVHLWTLDGEKHIITLHIVTQKEITVAELSQLKHNIRELCKQFGIFHATIELETEEEQCEFESGCC